MAVGSRCTFWGSTNTSAGSMVASADKDRWLDRDRDRDRAEDRDRDRALAGNMGIWVGSMEIWDSKVASADSTV